MWLITEFGFFSIVEKPKDRKRGTLTVRARSQSDLRQFTNLIGEHKPKMIVSQESDYRYRVIVKREVVADIVMRSVMRIDYDNFKSRIDSRQGEKRHDVYLRVWAALYQITLDEDRLRKFIWD